MANRWCHAAVNRTRLVKVVCISLAGVLVVNEDEVVD
jgi:hypothetical protein